MDFTSGRRRHNRYEPKTAAAGGAISCLDSLCRAVLKAATENEPFTLLELANVPPQTVQACLDRLSAMGILKCELTAAAGDPQGRTIWTVYPDFKEAASKL